MICSVIFMLVGLAATLAGVIIAFVSKPPVLDQVDAEKLWKSFNERPNTPEEAKAVAENAARSEKMKFRFSIVGVGLLITGTGLQIIGTLLQLIRPGHHF